MRRNARIGIAVVVAAVVALAAALLVRRGDEPLPEGSPGAVAVGSDGRRVEVTPLSGFEGIPHGLENAFAWAPDGSTSLVLGGSSSCPPVIESGTWDEETNAVRLTMAPPSAEVCTADLLLHAWTLTLDGETLAPERITLISADGGAWAVPRATP